MYSTREYRKIWNTRQTEFRHTLLSYEQHDQAMEMFFSQHAMLHSAQMSESELWSYEDEIFSDLSEDQARVIPSRCVHSIAWIIWHTARIEDVTMNLLVAGSPQVFTQDKWLKQMKIEVEDTGNASDMESVLSLSTAIDLLELREYRLRVGRRTRQVVENLQAEELQRRVEPDRLLRVADEGAVLPAASELLEYWGKRTIAGLLIMPPTWHCFTHLNEADLIKRRLP